MSVAGRSVNRGRFLVTTPGDIRSENADMSNEKSSENTIACQWKAFLRFSKSTQSESVPKEAPKGLPSDGYTKVTKLL